MTSSACSRTPPGACLQLTLRIPNFLVTDPSTGKKRLMPCVVSWNQVLGLEHWGRAKLKKQIQDAFLSALRAAAESSSMKTTSAKSSLSTAVATLACYQEMVRVKRKLRYAKKKLEKANPKKP